MPADQGTPNTSPVPQSVLDLLKLREGWRTAVYTDTKGLPTAGLGHLLSASEKAQYPVGTEVPLDTLNAWAQADTATAYHAAQSQAATLGVTDPNFITVLTSVIFQLGVGWNTIFKQTWASMVAHEWEDAAEEAEQSNWYKQTPVRVQDFQAALRALI